MSRRRLLFGVPLVVLIGATVAVLSNQSDPDAPVDTGSPLGEAGTIGDAPDEFKDTATMQEAFGVARHVL